MAIYALIFINCTSFVHLLLLECVVRKIFSLILFFLFLTEENNFGDSVQ